jgi:hypothetical protein
MNKQFMDYNHDAPRPGCDRPGFVRFYIWSLIAPTSDRSLGSEVYIYRINKSMIAIVAVRPNVILGRQYLFSPQKELSVFIFLGKHDML